MLTVIPFEERRPTPPSEHHHRQHEEDCYEALTHENWARTVLSEERNKQEQLKYLERIHKLKKELISRTILVDNVLDLKDPRNTKELRKFFQTKYGEVEQISVTCNKTGGGQKGERIKVFPSARVRFRRREPAQRVLSETIQDHLLDCPRLAIHQSGKIKITKARLYENMMKDVLGETEIEFTADSIAVGHYFPSDSPVYAATWNNSTTDDDNNNNIPKEEWLEETSMNESVTVRINLPKRLVEFETARHDTTESGFFDFRNSKDYLTFQFKELVGYLDVCRTSSSSNQQCCSLVFALKNSPQIHADTPTVGLGFACVEPDLDRKRSLSFGDFHAMAIGRCLGYKLNVSEPSIELLLLSKGLAKLQNFGIMRHTSILEARTIRTKVISDNDSALCAALEELHHRDARIGFLLRGLLDQGKTCWYDILNDIVLDKTGKVDNLVGIIGRLMVSGANNTIYETLSQMLRSHERTRRPCSAFLALANQHIEAEDLTLPDHCLPIPRILLTPSRQIVVGFEVETSNRVVRNFVEKYSFPAESFLRVTIGDECGRKLFWSDLTEPVESRIRQCMLSGVSINGMKYRFLAYSSSQLKECSFWMVSLNNQSTWTIEQMRISMGDFSSCLTPAQFAARMGQCFSTTFRGLQSCSYESTDDGSLRHILIPDIPSAYSGLVHTDGNGLIRRATCSELLRKIPSCPKDREDEYSIVQIRFGGSKGTLTAWDDYAFDKCLLSYGVEDPSQYHVAIRDSMVKFEARYERLEVCSIGSHSPYYLNRNVILLLCEHGVKERVFLNMQKQMLDDLDSMLTSPIKASSMISILGGPDQAHRSRLLNMLRCGLSPGTDPFLSTNVMAIRCYHLQGLLKKARIFVKDGAVLIGGVDDLNLLPEFCVFLQVSKFARRRGGLFANCEDDDFAPIIGPVLVKKHPNSHPGDVRMLLAVDIPQLRGHKNVLLFSQRGKRPEPNKMAGSDLDGDEYAVTWDRSLFLGQWNKCSEIEKGKFVGKGRTLLGIDPAYDARELQKVNKTPLSYAKPQKRSNTKQKNTLNDDGLVEHFLNFARNDTLGQIGCLWQDWASLNGAGCEQCLDLAKQHSIAVDFAKTGVPASIPNGARWRRNSKAHWREKNDELSYHCTSVIGKLYDEAMGRKDPPTEEKAPLGHFGRKLDRYGQLLSVLPLETEVGKYLKAVYDEKIPKKLGWSEEERLSDLNEFIHSFAEEQRDAYERNCIKLMNKYELRNEGELFTGCIRKCQHLHKKRQHEIAEEVRRQSRHISHEVRCSFFRQVLVIVNALRRPTPTLRAPPGFETFSTVEFVLKEESDEDRLDLDELKHQQHQVEFTDEEIEQCSMVGTDNASLSDSNRERRIRKVARLMAAAYYMASYSPFRQRNNRRVALFGFPWIVSDVIASGAGAKERVTAPAPFYAADFIAEKI